jgi:PGF-pre-PGF domain-containing protein
MNMNKIAKALLFLLVILLSTASALSVNTPMKFTYRNPSDSSLVYSAQTNGSVNVTLPAKNLDLVFNSLDERFEVAIQDMDVTVYPTINITVYNSSRLDLPARILNRYNVRDAFAFEVENQLNKTVTVKFRRSGNFPTINTPRILKAPFNFTNLTTDLTQVTPLTTYTEGSYVYVAVDTFSNFILVDDRPYQPPGGGGGGGSGGGGSGTGGGYVYGGVPLSGLRANQTFVSVGPSIPINMLVDNPDIAIVQLKIELIRILTDVNILIEKMISKPLSIPQPDGSLYQYDKITYTNMDNDDILSVEIVFRIPDSWFPENNAKMDNVVLMAYDGASWQKLTAVRTTSENGYTYYKSKTDSLSTLYSFVSLKTKAPLEPVTGRPITEREVQPPVVDIPPEEEEEGFNFLLVLIPLLIVAVLLVGGAGAYVLVQKQKQERQPMETAAKPVYVPPKTPKLDPSRIKPIIAAKDVTELQKKQLQKYVFHALSRGYTHEQVKVKLLIKGWPKETVNELIHKGDHTHVETHVGIEGAKDAVRKLLAKGHSKGKIKDVMKAKGWTAEQIKEIFSDI